MEGYIALHKSLLSWRWIDDPCAVCLWVQLLLRANYEDKNWHDTVIKRGQLVTTLGDLAKQTGLSMRQIRTRLDWLESAECINRQTTNKYTIITICKYDSYQCPEKANGKQTTNKRQTNDKQNGKQNDKQNVSANDYERGSYGDAKSESDKQNDKQKIGETTRLYNKERINNNSCFSYNVCACEEEGKKEGELLKTSLWSNDELYKELAEDDGWQTWRETFCMNLKLTPDGFQKILREFNELVKLRMETHDSIQNYARHFTNYIYLNSKANDNNKSTTGYISRDDQRKAEADARRAAVAQRIAERIAERQSKNKAAEPAV